MKVIGLKRFLPHYLIIGLLLVLTAFSLPSFGNWVNFSKTINQLKTPTILLGSYQHPPIPHLSDAGQPQLLAENYILIDNTTNTILLSRNPYNRIYPASITKLATALTALNIYPLEELITVKDAYLNGQNMNLQPGVTLTVKSLVSALLVHSANDAAFNLAYHHQDGITGFIKQMNLIVTKSGLKNTHFTNFDGLQDPNHYSTVYDLSQLGSLAIKNPIIRQTVKDKTITVTDVTGKNIYDLNSTNELLGVVPEIEGLKTGWTPEAGGCFIALININGHELISVVAQSPDRFADTKNIVTWAKSTLFWSPYQP
jgi:serine-type D-Ala-D-Ala carboxypeptidase (penicillin-binding protein 5/6)